MRSVHKSLFAGVSAAAMLGVNAFAADLPPPPPMVYQPVVVQPFGGWYLRGDIGITNQQVDSLQNVLIDGAINHQWLDEPSFTSGMSYGLGIGYQVNDWLRLDLTGEYRSGSDFRALDSFLNGAAVNTNDYTAVKREWLFLMNAYLDLGTWWCITPFIGAGVGFSNLTIANFRDNNIIAGGGGWAPDQTETNFAWAIHAGASYAVTKNFAVEFSYRYVNLGDGMTGDEINLDGSNLVTNPFTLKDITSHDFRIGLRWMLGGDIGAPVHAAGFAPAPVYSQPAQVLQIPQQTYAPPPVYTSPQYAPPPPQYAPPPNYDYPLSRRG